VVIAVGEQPFNDNQYREQVDALADIDTPETIRRLAENASPEGKRAARERLEQIEQQQRKGRGRG
jgi:hypothetical protein